MPGGVYRDGLPRSDLKVTLDEVEVKPAPALGSWLAFRKIGDQAMVMGDLVLTAEEVSPVMDKLVEGGIDITALHNHLALNTANTAPIVHVRQNPARKPIETVQPRSTVALIEASSWMLLRTSPIGLSDSIVTDGSEMIRCEGRQDFSMLMID